MSQNRLGFEKSPYLLQHRDNPVHWYAWGNEAFEAATKEDKPVFLSIGYSTCYWCHVMEKESFEDEEVASALNREFICIKVDREEHPEIDQIYMEAVVALTGHGGWPMSVFLTPDRKPFFGGTYFQKPQFIELIERIGVFWKEHRQELQASADKITRVIAAHLAPQNEDALRPNLLDDAFKHFSSTFDEEFGGHGTAPKFPPHSGIPFLFRYFRKTANPEALQMALKTLDMMALGGIHDQLCGGFHRYSTDQRWLVPHFEKMLYDNALLTRNYVDAYRITGNTFYRDVVESTLNYLLRDMRDARGGFYSAEDAGDVGDEGAFYTWSKAELKECLDEQSQSLFFTAFGVTDRGVLEGKNILAIQQPYGWGIKQELEHALNALRERRAHRNRPHRDDKVLTGWNGLAITAFALGHQITGDDRYLQAASECAAFLKSSMWTGTELLRRFRDGESRFSGSLEDYAYLIDGLLNLYQTSFDPRWAEWAVELQHAQDRLFLDENRGAYFFAAHTSDVLFRRKDFVDSATPSPNAVTAQNLFALFQLTGEPTFMARCNAILQIGANEVERHPSAFATLLTAYDSLRDGGREIVLSSPAPDAERQAIWREIWKRYLPTTLFADASQNNVSLPLITNRAPTAETLFYVCKGMTCDKPTASLEEALRALS